MSLHSKYAIRKRKYASYSVLKCWWVIVDELLLMSYYKWGKIFWTTLGIILDYIADAFENCWNALPTPEQVFLNKEKGVQIYPWLL